MYKTIRMWNGTFVTVLLAAAAFAPVVRAETADAGPPTQPAQYIIVCADKVEGRYNPDPAESGFPYFKRGDVEPDAGDVVVAVGGRYWRRIGDDRYRDEETYWVEDRYLLPLEAYEPLRAVDEMARANEPGAAAALRAANASLGGDEDRVSISPDGCKAMLRLGDAGAYDDESYALTGRLYGRYGVSRILYFEAGRGFADIFYYTGYSQEMWAPDGRRWFFIGRAALLHPEPCVAVTDNLYVYDTAAGGLESLGPCTWYEEGYPLEFTGPYVVWLGAEEKTLDIGDSYPTPFLMPALFAYRFDTGEKIKLLAADPATMAREPSGTAPCAGNIYYPVELKAVGEPPPELGASPLYRKLNGAIADAVTNEA